ncbi:MAG: SRPBCC family protein [Oceanococcaceae bacterium]
MTQSFTAPVEAVFSVLADHNQLGSILGGPVKRIEDGTDDVNGTGSVRRIGLGPVGLDETVVEFVPNEKIVYRITRGGFPVRNHEGRLSFARDGEGCTVQWAIDFDTTPALIGGGVAKALEKAIGGGLKKLAARL